MEEALQGSLRELLESPSYEWIFVGGKGGVGKTTTACALAAKLASTRDSVLVLSTDPAHNLSDAFGQKFSGKPTLVQGFSNLYAMEIDSSFQETGSYRLKSDEAWAKILPELLQALPGIDEAISFTELMQSVQNMKYSAIVFDTAPTGHTLKLLGFPDTLENGLKKFISWKSQLSPAIGMLNMVAGPSIDEAEISSKLDHLKAITTSIRQTFQDPAKTTFVCVCIAEFLSVYETERLVQELAKQSIDCSNIVVNQVLFPIEGEEEGSTETEEAEEEVPPEELRGEAKELVEKLLRENAKLRKRVKRLAEAYRSRRIMQSKYLQQIDDLYSADFHVACVPQQLREVRGATSIRAFGELLDRESSLPILEDESL